MIKRTKVGLSKTARRLKIKSVLSKYDNLNSAKFETNPNMNDFRAIKKDFILSDISPAAKAIYPVLCMLSNFSKDKPIQVSKANIGEYSGLKSWITITKALEELKFHAYIECKKVINERTYFVYKVDYPRRKDMIRLKESGETLPYIKFHTCIIKSKIWPQLTPKEQSLYLTLRAISKFEFESSTRADYENRTDAFLEEFKNRTWDYYYGTAKYLRETAGIARNSILIKMLTSLKDYGLISVMDFNDNNREFLEISVWLYPESLLNDEGLVKYEGNIEADEEYEEEGNVEPDEEYEDDIPTPVVKDKTKSKTKPQPLSTSYDGFDDSEYEEEQRNGKRLFANGNDSFEAMLKRSGIYENR